jgi:general secretion pathway protein L
MKLLRPGLAQFSHWIDTVANVIVKLAGRLSQSRVVELVEGNGGQFTVRKRGARASSPPLAQLQIGDDRAVSASTEAAASLKGSRAEIVLQPSHFVFRQVELPRRASEFLDGIIRAQIDRLTPWSDKEAVFGWAKPVDVGSDKIAVTVAASSRTLVTPYVQAVSALGADSVLVLTTSEASDSDPAPITVFEQMARTRLEPQAVRRALAAILLIAVIAAASSIGAAYVIAGNLEARQDELVRRLADRRAALRASLNAENDTALSRLERRKHENPSTVLVLEALTKVLPDHTHVTELRIEGNKLQVIGVTRDAPSLIKLIEQSSYFTHATFFAPTTRSPSDPGDRFHIEARIASVPAPRT